MLKAASGPRPKQLVASARFSLDGVPYYCLEWSYGSLRSKDSIAVQNGIMYRASIQAPARRWARYGRMMDLSISSFHLVHSSANIPYTAK
mmetsp:Transcript_1542/g.2348  ORF Transcript_1542/g.2348 Transcript_1542/m.2348 type:complete len:90 (+) Transcript_1542:315-584(+)